MASTTGCGSARPAPEGPFGDDDQPFAPVSFFVAFPGIWLRRHRVRRDKPGSHGRRRVDGSGFDVLRVVVTAVDDDQILDAADDVELTVEVDA